MSIFTPRVNAKPFEHPDLIRFVDAMTESYWTVNEFKNVTADVHDYHVSLAAHERTAAKRSLLAISQIEVGVKDFWGHIGDRLPKAEIKLVAYSFAESEGRHFRAYSHWLEVLGLNEEFQEILKTDVIQGRVDYLTKYLKNASSCSEEAYTLTLTLFSLFVENVSLFVQFAIIKSFRKYRNQLPTLDNIVQATQKEETLHALFGATLVNIIKAERPEWFNASFYRKLQRAAEKAYAAELRILDWIYEDGELDFLPKATLVEFLKDRFNLGLSWIGAEKAFETDQAEVEKLRWFEEEIKTGTNYDFFHLKSTAYSKFRKPYTGRDLYRPESPFYREPSALALPFSVHPSLVDPVESRSLTASEIAKMPRSQEAKPFDNNGFRWLTPDSQKFLDKGYLEGLTVEERVDVIGNAVEQRKGVPGFAAKFKDYMRKGWISLSTPVWCNFGNDRGLPISCFGSYMEDNIESILFTHAEIGVMTKYGGGTSAYFGNLRQRGASIRGNGESFGSVHFMQLSEAITNIVSQGKTRRGQIAPYQRIDHPDASEFLKIRFDGNPLQEVNPGLVVPDEWLEEMENGDEDKRNLMANVHEARGATGFPYIIFEGNVQRGAPDCYQSGKYKIVASNLCSEIALPSNAEESFVCCLASMNILHFDEWKDTDVVAVVALLLDAVMDEFIEKASKIKFGFLDRAVRFAERHRALGIGWLGWHSYLQSKMIPFESFEAKMANIEVAKNIEEKAYAASADMAVVYGEPEVLKGLGRRNTTLLAIAPTKSSAFILGQVSEGVEPIRSNYFIDEKAKGKFTYRNRALEALLESKGLNTQEVWDSILSKAGSVQHLEALTDHERAVFKTFGEISPKEIIIQAGARQNFIDQSQSINLMIDPEADVADVHELVMLAWRLGVKSLYYQINESAAQKLSRDLLECVSCSA